MRIEDRFMPVGTYALHIGDTDYGAPKKIDAMTMEANAPTFLEQREAEQAAALADALVTPEPPPPPWWRYLTDRAPWRRQR